MDVSPGPPAGAEQKRGVRVTIEQAELTVNPGSEATTGIAVRNLGTRVEEFRLVPRGPAAAFAAITPTTLSVYPGDEQRAVARFAPERGPQSPAGVASFEIVARSAIHGDVSDLARGRLTVTPFENLSAVLAPELSRGRKPGRHLVSVTNGGNVPVNTQLTFRDPDGELTFEPPDSATMLSLGATQDFPVLINGRRRWFGRTERLPFSATVTPTSPQPPITLNGTRCQTAVFPWWVPTAALAAVALVIALFAVWPGPKVPGIGLRPEATAVQLLRDAGYEPDVIRFPDNGIAEGLAIKTDPAGGMQFPRGEHVKLYISAGKCEGPCPVEVPSVEGLPLSEARAKLEADKFEVRPVREPSDLPVDQVVKSDPPATTLRQLGSLVVLTVSSGPQASSAPPPPPPPPPGPPPPVKPPAPIEVPDLTAKTADDALKVLTGLGLKPKAATVHSNAVADGQVLSTTPAATTKVDPGSDVTMNVARNTAFVDLIATASQAAWRNGSAKLTFPGKDTDTTGFVLIRDAATLEDGSTATVLETSPPKSGLITGVYKLADPAVAGDHVRARVGLLKGGTGEVVFLVKAANGKVIQQLTDTVDGKLKEFDADLSAAKGATSVEITVLAGGSSTGAAAVWQDLRLEPQVG